MTSKIILVAFAATWAGSVIPTGYGWPAAPLKEVQAAAERGDATAQLELGGRYERGDGVESDLKTAIKWYRRAARQTGQIASFKSGGVNGAPLKSSIASGRENSSQSIARHRLKSALSRLQERNGR